MNELQQEWSNQELTELYTKCHEALEGRYDLSGEDLYNLEVLVSQIRNYLYA